jgi:hypothetical protein
VLECRSDCEPADSNIDGSDLYSGYAMLESVSEVFCGFPEFLQKNERIVTLDKPLPLPVFFFCQHNMIILM